MSSVRLLGLDLGSKTIGLAVSDVDGRVATPVCTLERCGGETDLVAVAEVVREHAAQAIVIGLPLKLDGQEGGAAKRVREFGERLAAKLGCDVHYVDERFTTREAEKALIGAGVKRAKRKQWIDQSAAVLILQTYLDTGTRSPL